MSPFVGPSFFFFELLKVGKVISEMTGHKQSTDSFLLQLVVVCCCLPQSLGKTKIIKRRRGNNPCREMKKVMKVEAPVEALEAPEQEKEEPEEEDERKEEEKR